MRSSHIPSTCAHSNSSENEHNFWNLKYHSSISVGPDHVTRVEIDPRPSYGRSSEYDEGFYSQSYDETIYGNPSRVGLSVSPANNALFSENWRNASSASPTATADSQISIQCNRIYGTNKTAKFPVSMDFATNDSRNRHV
uniref:Uncharacterized protein n=1 Tax=Romanomermis culicivorax TaxID=13658 RepID=A0A915LD73_ROMCU